MEDGQSPKAWFFQTSIQFTWQCLTASRPRMFVKGVFQSYNEGFTSSTALCKLHLKGLLQDLSVCLFTLV